LKSFFCLIDGFSSDFQTPAITAQDLHTRQGSTAPLLEIDVCNVAEYQSGDLPGSITIPRKKPARQLDGLLDTNGVVLWWGRLAEPTLIGRDVPNVFHWRVTSWAGGMYHDVETQEVA
jgi:hypothetical protein